MVRKIVLTICLSIISNLAQSNEELIAISRFDLNTLSNISKSSCVSQLFLHAASGNVINSTMVKNCLKCADSVEYDYYCQYINFLSSINNNDYKSASTYLKKIAQKLKLSDEDYLKKASIHYEKLSEKYEKVKFNLTRDSAHLSISDGYWKFNIGSNMWLFDSAATFGAGSLLSCSGELSNSDALNTLGFTNNFDWCQNNVFGDIYLPMIHSDSRILGLTFFKIFKEIQTNNKTKKTEYIDLFYNGKFIVLQSRVNFKNSSFENLNMCLDSGSSDTQGKITNI